MPLSDKEIEERIEKTVYKLEKFYKLYNFIYKIKQFNKKVKEIIVKHFILFMLLYTVLIYILVKFS